MYFYSIGINYELYVNTKITGIQVLPNINFARTTKLPVRSLEMNIGNLYYIYSQYYHKHYIATSKKLREIPKTKVGNSSDIKKI